ncbi:MAG: HAMP domain-containing histidine kinase [Deltaproteobacteria bacterium]|nr:HAMP domain-containing histidine kinase [Deltaproteobacteria bacterium]
MQRFRLDAPDDPLRAMDIAIVFLGAPAIAGFGLAAFRGPTPPGWVWLYWGAGLALLGMAAFGRRLALTVRAWAYVELMLLFTLGAITSFGPLPGAGAFLASAVVLSALLLPRTTVVPLLAQVAAVIGLAGWIRPAGLSSLDWLRVGTAVLVILTPLAIQVHALRKRQDDAHRAGVETLKRLHQESAETIRLSNELEHSLRAGSMGKVASGMAHRLGQTLSEIRLSTQRLATAAESEERRSAETALSSALRRAEAIATQLQNLTPLSPSSQRRSSLSLALQASTRTLRRLLPDDIELIVVIEVEPWVDLPLSSLENLFLHLALNARDAMPHGGELSLRLFPEGGQVVLCAADTGAGMDEATLAQATSPGFTTRRGRQGAGFGLPSVLADVESVGGSLTLSSSPDRGTEVRIALVPQAPPPSVLPESPLAVTPRAVQVVASNRRLREGLVRMLEREGHEVTAVPEVDRVLLDQVDVVVLGCDVPAEDRAQLRRRAASSSSAPILACDPLDTPPLEPGPGRLPSPFTPSQLRQAIAQATRAR